VEGSSCTCKLPFCHFLLADLTISTISHVNDDLLLIGNVITVPPVKIAPVEHSWLHRVLCLTGRSACGSGKPTLLIEAP